MARDSKLIDIHGYVKRETERAILFASSDRPKEEVWLPRSKITIQNSDSGDGVHVTMPEWLLIEKGLC
jgi:hypothetical protein